MSGEVFTAVDVSKWGDVRRQVAEIRGVDQDQVKLLLDNEVMACDEEFIMMDIQKSITAVVQQFQPEIGAIPPRGAGFYCAKHKHVFEFDPCKSLMLEGPLLLWPRKPLLVHDDEWIAVCTCRVYQEVVQLTEAMTSCTEESCPRMCAGQRVLYKWQDSPSSEPRHVSAVCYRDMSLEFAQERLFSEDLIPHTGSPLPESFITAIRAVMKKIFRIYAHILLHHLQEFQIREDNSLPDIIVCFQRFLHLVQTFSLLSRDEMTPLSSFIDRLNLV
mmetsp:Transcript_74156/g.128626  ORF Transcript_74156/g.128626 Transcript_74156/m.128626 type:complete len:273 (+) Transcript_74156:3-821(+)